MKVTRLEAWTVETYVNTAMLGEIGVEMPVEGLEGAAFVDAVRKIAGRMSLMGNVNNPEVLYQGTPEDVHRQVRYAVAAGVNIIAPECAIPLSTPLENLRAIVEAAHEGY